MAYPHPLPRSRKRPHIAIGGIHSECASNSPLIQREGEFRRLEGDALMAQIDFDFAARDIEPVPLFFDRSLPGGPLDPQFFAARMDEFLARLRAAMPVDGVLLMLHGALFVPGLDDPEGALAMAVRQCVGAHCLIAASFDLHGQMSAQICTAIDIFSAYRTAPHTDVARTHGRAAQMLADAMHSGRRPHTLYAPVPLLVSGDMCSTRIAPGAQLYGRLAQYDRLPGIINVSLLIGYLWADCPRAGGAAVVTCLDHAAGARVCAHIAEEYWQSRHKLRFEMDSGDLDVFLSRPRAEFTILADSGDNPTAGGVGDRADVLAAMMSRFGRPGNAQGPGQGLAQGLAQGPAQGPAQEQGGRRGDGPSVLFAGIAAPESFARLANGARRIAPGGELGGGGPVVELDIDACRIVGDTALASCGALTIAVDRQRRPWHRVADFRKMGVGLEDFSIVVVKSGYLSVELAGVLRARANSQSFMALTKGVVCQDITQIANRHRAAPLFPFQKAFDFAPRIFPPAG